MTNPTKHPQSAIRNPHPSRRFSRPGFTLVEAALTTVIVGTGVLAIVAAQQAYHRKNAWAQKTNTAMLLANEIHELTVFMPLSDPAGGNHVGPETDEYTNGQPDVHKFNDLDDFAGAGDHSEGTTFTPPINALRQPITDMSGWSQQVMVKSVGPKHVASTFTLPLGQSDMMRVKVIVKFKGPHDNKPHAVTSLTWLAE